MFILKKTLKSLSQSLIKSEKKKISKYNIHHFEILTIKMINFSILRIDQKNEGKTIAEV